MTKDIESLFRLFVRKSHPMTNDEEGRAEGKEVYRGRLEARADTIMVS